MKSVPVCALSMCLMGLATSANAEAPALRAGAWHAWLDTSGGALPFGIELRQKEAAWRAWVINGPERIDVPKVRWEGGRLVIDMEHYDSKITAKPNADGTRLDGEWVKAIGDGEWSRLPFHARSGLAPRFTPVSLSTPEAVRKIDGRWSIRFATHRAPSVGVFKSEPNGTVTGTIMTTTGDYRYLAGLFDGKRLQLSCFDGAHAFLFDAKLTKTGALQGDFWSRDAWHDTWIARRNEAASLPDDFTQTRAIAPVPLSELSFPDVDGVRRTLSDPAFAGKARIIEVFGTWCPNCTDATRLLVELDQRYRTKGLSIVGLAFEVSGKFERDARQVRRYITRNSVKYPILLAGSSDKWEAGIVLPFLDRVRSYPTTIFTDANGNVHAIHTGFTGPATGDAYESLRSKFEKTIERLLGEKSGS